MGTRASRLQEDPVPAAFGKDGPKRDSYRRPRCARPTSLMVDISVSFEEASRSRSEEGSDSDLGGPHGASADGSPADHRSVPAGVNQASPAEDNGSEGKPEEEDGNISPDPPAAAAEHQPGEETGRTPHRTFSERLPGTRHSSARSVGQRSARIRVTHQRPVSEAWIGLYRVNNRHGNIRCPFCSKPFPGGRIEDHLLSCLTSPPLPYNTDVLSKDSGECSICLEDLVQGETIARLACLCVYHKRMTTTADQPKEAQDAPGYDAAPSPPSYSYQNEQPPPYSAAATYPPPKVETTDTFGYESFRDICPEDPSDTTPLVASSSFDDKTVFSIITLQLLFTFSVVCVFTFSSVVKEAVQTNLWAYLSSFIIFVVVASALGCCQSFSRRHPWNIVALAVITLSLSYMVGTIASFHNTKAVIITMGATMAISLAIIAFSAQTRYDFTICYGILLILAVDLAMFGIFCTFYYSYIGEVVYGCLGALLYSLFLTIHCQLLMGTMSYRLDPEEYVNAALMIYLDIVLIFLYLLGRR
ncbi:hypothetical protein L3Q82_021257 [Scortum barcoo]|uniref:Uncharacterized protein n=1 Tax=Scortum barcoo TaxID=214431 RepID=A0ACB8X3L7_9TELE|nr:hypothetical protein L3Q82_021257 [Scortum barcoo]